MTLKFPAGAQVTLVNLWGVAKRVPAHALANLPISFGSSPTYVISTKPILETKVVGHR